MKVVIDISILLVLNECGMLGECPWTITTTDLVAHLLGEGIAKHIHIEKLSPDEMNELAVFHHKLQGTCHITIQDSSALYLAKTMATLLLTNDEQISKAAKSVGIEVSSLQEMTGILSTHCLRMQQSETETGKQKHLYTTSRLQAYENGN